MGQTTGGDGGINSLLGAELSVGLAPVARIRGDHNGERTSCSRDALHQLLRRSLRLRQQMFDIGRLVAHTQRHDHLMVADDSQLAVVALDVMTIGRQPLRGSLWLQMTISIREIPLGLLGWRAVGLPRQTTPGHCLTLQRLEIWWFHSGFHRGFDRLLSRSFCFRSCRLSSLVQFRLLSRGCILFFGGISLGSG